MESTEYYLSCNLLCPSKTTSDTTPSYCKCKSDSDTNFHPCLFKPLF